MRYPKKKIIKIIFILILQNSLNEIDFELILVESKNDLLSYFDLKKFIRIKKTKKKKK